MAADVSTLVLAVDSSQVVNADKNLLGMSNAADKAEKSTGELEKASNFLRNTLAALGVGLLVKELIQTADAMTLTTARLSIAVGGYENLKKAQLDSYNTSQQNNVGILETMQLYSKLAEPVMKMGGTTREVTGIVDAFAKSLKIGGASTQEASAATLQFAQAMASGRLNGDEFRSLAEASPRFMKALADGIGVPTGALKEMASEGKLTADVVGNALIGSLGKLSAEALKIPDTVGGALTRVKNDIIVAVDDLNKNSGLTLGIADLIEMFRTQLLPVVVGEIGGAFKTVSDFIGENRAAVEDVWINVKALAAEVWEVLKPIGAITLAIGAWLLQSDALKNSVTALRILIAGLKDGVDILGAAFVWVGAQVLKVVGWVDEGAAALARSAQDYADKTFARFAEGDTELAKLSASLAKTKTNTDQMREAMTLSGAAINDNTAETAKLARQATSTDGEYRKLVNSTKTLTDEQKKAETQAKRLAEADAKVYAGLVAINTGLNADFLGKWESLSRLYNKGKITLGQLTDSQAVLLAHQPRIKQELDAVAESHDTAIKNYLAEWDAQIKVEKSTRDIINGIKLETQYLQLSATEKEIAIGLRKAELDGLVKGTQAYDDFAAALRAAVMDKGAVQAGLDGIKAQTEAAKKFNDDLGKGLTDTLFRAFESGKGFFSTLWSGITNLFKTTVLKLLISPVQTGITDALGSLFGGSGGIGSLLGSAGGAGGGLGGMLGGLGGIGASLGAFGTAAGYGASALFGGTGLTALSGGASMIGAGSLASGFGMIAGVLGPIALGVGALAALIKKFDTSGTPHSGGSSAYSGLGGLSVGTGLYGVGSNAGGYNTQTEEVTTGLVKSIVSILDSTATAFGKTAGYTAAAGFADDSSKDGAWGALMIQKLGQTVAGFGAGNGSDGDRWPGLTLADGKAGLDQFVTMTAQQTKDALLSIGLPEWANSVVTALGGAPTLEQLAAATESIIKTQNAITSLGLAFDPLGGVFGRIGSLSDTAKMQLIGFAGGIESLVSQTAQFVSDYYSAGEQAAITANSITSALSSVGLGGLSLSSKDEFRALVDNTDISTELGRQQLATLLAIAPDFAKLSTYLTDEKTTLTALAATAPQTELMASLNQSTAAATQATADAAQRTADQIAVTNSTLATISQQGAAQLVALESMTAAFTQAVSALGERQSQDYRQLRDAMENAQ